MVPTKQPIAYESLCSRLAVNGVWFRCMFISELVNNHGDQYPSYQVRAKWRVASLVISKEILILVESSIPRDMEVTYVS